MHKHACGSLNNGTPPKDVYGLIPGICECHHKKLRRCDQTKNLKEGDIVVDYLGGPM